MAEISAKEYPLIISFYSGERYYSEAGDQLKRDCERFSLDHYIQEATPKPPSSWIDITRYKVRFIHDCIEKFNRPLFFMDVDCRILREPAVLKNNPLDMLFFLRGFQYLRDFDPLASMRMFHPAFLYINNSKAAKAFIALEAILENEGEENTTDDFYLHEAWRAHKEQLNIGLLSPKIVAFKMPAANDEIFYFGRSGSVEKYRESAKQHEPALFSRERMEIALMEEFRRAKNEGKKIEAALLLTRALSYKLSPRW